MKFYFPSIIFLVILGFSACDSADDFKNKTPMSNRMPPTIRPLPPLPGEIANLGWTLTDGRKQKISDFKGKAVVLDFWATYCPPCVEAIPHLVALQNEKQAQGFEVIGLHVGGDDDKKLVPNFVSKYSIQYILATPDPALMSFYLGDDDRIPQTLVFDRQGRLVQKFVGFNSQIKADLDKAIEQALKTE